ncbi:MAG: oxidase [Verrucomicrobia bacterium]|nr:oxidase [Verrucomicrobiota bacterium]
MKDFLLDENDDLAINGDLLIVDKSDEQHQRLLLLTNKGDWKESATVGVGILRWLKDEGEGLLAEIKKEFEKDGMTVKKIDLTEGKLTTDAAY